MLRTGPVPQRQPSTHRRMRLTRRCQLMWYEIRLELDNDGILLVTAPAFPEVISFADDVEDALQHGHDAIGEAITRQIAHGEPIPEPLKEKPERGYFVEAPA